MSRVRHNTISVRGMTLQDVQRFGRCMACHDSEYNDRGILTCRTFGKYCIDIKKDCEYSGNRRIENV